MPTRTRVTRGRRGTSTAAPAVATRRSPRGQNRDIVDAALDDEEGGDPIWDPPTRTYDRGATLLDMLDVIDGTNVQRQPESGIASSSSSSSSSSSPTHPEAVPAPTRDTNGRRFTAAEKGKGRAPPAETITISDNEEGDDSIVVTGMKRKVHEVEDEDEVVDGVLGGALSEAEDAEEEVEAAEQEQHRLGEFSEWWLLCCVLVWEVVLMARLPRMFLRTNTSRHDRLVSVILLISPSKLAASIADTLSAVTYSVPNVSDHHY